MPCHADGAPLPCREQVEETSPKCLLVLIFLHRLLREDLYLCWWALLLWMVVGLGLAATQPRTTYAGANKRYTTECYTAAECAGSVERG